MRAIITPTINPLIVKLVPNLNIGVVIINKNPITIAMIEITF